MRDTRLYVSNLALSTDKQRLSDVFSKYGEVLQVDLLRKPFGNRTKVFAFIKFQSFEECQKAKLALNYVRLDGQVI